MNNEEMSCSRPYFIRALYDWIVDNGMTPDVLVDAQAEGVEVPLEHVNGEGQIWLNMAPRAVSNFHMDLESISFLARFSGISHQIFVPPNAVLGVFSRENGKGMMFVNKGASPPPPKGGFSSAAKSDAGKSASKPRPNLKVVQ